MAFSGFFEFGGGSTFCDLRGEGTHLRAAHRVLYESHGYESLKCLTCPNVQ